MNDTITQTVLSLLDVGITNSDPSIMCDIWELLSDEPAPTPKQPNNSKVTKHYNTWKDSVELAEFETDQDKVLYNPLTPRNRPPAKMVEITCSVCGRKEEINANFYNPDMMQTYRCGRCIS